MAFRDGSVEDATMEQLGDHRNHRRMRVEFGESGLFSRRIRERSRSLPRSLNGPNMLVGDSDHTTPVPLDQRDVETSAVDSDVFHAPHA